MSCRDGSGVRECLRIECRFSALHERKGIAIYSQLHHALDSAGFAPTTTRKSCRLHRV